MHWLRDPVWQQGLAIVFVTGGAALVYQDAAQTGDMGGRGLFGFAFLAAGVALPLVSQMFRTRRELTAGADDV